MIPFTQSRILFAVFFNNQFVLLYEYYIGLCLTILLDFISDGISFLLSCYRLISIVIVRRKITFNVKLHFTMDFSQRDNKPFRE